MEHPLRRSIVLACAATGVAAASPAAVIGQPFFKRTGLGIGAQLYSFSTMAYSDLNGTLKAVAEIGFRSVEPAGLLGKSPRDLRASLDAVGLACPSVQLSARALVPGPDPVLGGDLHRVVEAAHALGATYVVMPIFYIPERLKLIPKPGEDIAAMMARLGSEMTLDDWKYNVDFLNEKGRALKEAGLRLAYHNHNMEFIPLGGTSGYEVLLKGADPETVWLEMDVGWVTAAGHDPIQLLRDNPGRYRLMHVRDIKRIAQPAYGPGEAPTVLGTGSIDWKTVIPAAYASGVRHFIIEQEPAAGDQRVSAVRASFDYLEALVT